MSLHPQLLAKAPVANRSGIFRLKALFSEQRAKEASEPRSRDDWAELAIEWHMLANLSANANRESIPIDPLESQNAWLSWTRFSVAVGLDGRAHDPRSGQKAHRRSINAVIRFIADETAATAIEYCLIATGIALGIFVAVAGIEARINAEFSAINSSLK